MSSNPKINSLSMKIAKLQKEIADIERSVTRLEQIRASRFHNFGLSENLGATFERTQK